MSSSAALWCTWEPTVVIFGAYMALEPHYSQIMPPPTSKVAAAGSSTFRLGGPGFPEKAKCPPVPPEDDRTGTSE